MKSILLFIGLFVFSTSYCQSPCELAFTLKTDKFSGKQFYQLDSLMMVNDESGKLGFGVTFRKNAGSPEITMAFALAGINCFKGDDSVMFLFTDGSKYSVINRANQNCDGLVFIQMGGALAMKKALTTFREHTIDAIRFYNINSVVQIDINEADGELINKYIKCLSEIK